MNLVTAAIILFNCRYLGRAVERIGNSAGTNIGANCSQISPLGWDHINLTGDYIFSDNARLDDDGFLPLRVNQE